MRLKERKKPQKLVIIIIAIRLVIISAAIINTAKPGQVRPCE